MCFCNSYNTRGVQPDFKTCKAVFREQSFRELYLESYVNFSRPIKNNSNVIGLVTLTSLRFVRVTQAHAASLRALELGSLKFEVLRIIFEHFDLKRTLRSQTYTSISNVHFDLKNQLRLPFKHPYLQLHPKQTPRAPFKPPETSANSPNP